MKEKIIVTIIGCLILLFLTIVVMYFTKVLNAVTLQTNVIEPRSGIECVVVNANDSTGVDCWFKSERE